MSFALALAASLLLVRADAQPAPSRPDSTVIARFHQVDERLYRGAQPDAAGFRYLQELGIKTVINLRMEEDANKVGEPRLVESLGMRYVSLPVQDNSFFKRSRTLPDDTVRRFFATLEGAEGPVFVHCERGADRTGALVALYRIVRHGWNNQRAYDEAREIGMRSWYSGFKRQILEFRPPAALDAHP